MEREPLDLSALDPTKRPARFERLIAGVMARARPELARRAARTPVLLWQQLAGWSRPMLAAASVTALIATAVLAATRGGGFELLPDTVDARPGTVSVLIDDWTLEARAPAFNDVLVAFEGEVP
jgi:hypothetical protein